MDKLILKDKSEIQIESGADINRMVTYCDSWEDISALEE